MLFAAAAALALVAAAAGQESFDCAKGCTLSTDLVCGDDGLTYMGACLAACGPSKTTVAHPGACGPPSADGGGRASAAFEGDLAAHPVASMFDMQAVDADANRENSAEVPPTYAVTPADLARYAADGFALVGAGKVAPYDIDKAGDAAAKAKVAATASPSETTKKAPLKGAAAEAAVIEPRVLALAADTGLLYAATAPFEGSTKVGEAAVSPGARGPGDDGLSEAAAAEGEVTPSAEGMGPDFQPERWIEFTSKQGYPWRQHAWLDSGCSGTVMGPHTVLTAAHCVWSQSARSFYPLYTVRPAAFRTDNGRGSVQSPYGSFPASRVLVLSGWTDNAAHGGGQSIWFFDTAVIVTAGEVAKDVGFAGFTYNPNGVSGVPLMTAGWPQTTQSRGRFMRMKSVCKIEDTDGNDAVIAVDISECAVAEGGQSGSGLWNMDTHIVSAVLSRGTDEYDFYYQFTPTAFDFLKTYKDVAA